MRKKFVILFLLFIILLGINAYAAEYANIPACKVTLNGQEVDNTYRQYPLLQYRDIVYFPMTYFDCRFLGVATNWQADTSTLIINKRNMSGAYRDYSWENKNSTRNKVDICAFNIEVNGNAIYNANEPYPLLVFRDVTYFPLTWRFAVDEFGWQYSYDEENGLVITSDNNICKRMPLPDIGDFTFYAGAADEDNFYAAAENGRVYRIPRDNPAGFTEIYETAINPMGRHFYVTFFSENGKVYMEHTMGSSAAMMQTVYKCINPDGTVTNADDITINRYFTGESYSTIPGEGFSLRRYRGIMGDTHLYITKDGEEEKEITIPGVYLCENGKNYTDESYYEAVNPKIVGTNVYIPTKSQQGEGNSNIYVYDTVTGESKLVLEDIGAYVAFVGRDMDSGSNSDNVVYQRNGKIFSYSLASGKTYEIGNEDLPLIYGTTEPDSNAFLLYFADGNKSTVRSYHGYGFGGNSGKSVVTVNLPTSVFKMGSAICLNAYGDGSGVKTAVIGERFFNFQSSDESNHLFVNDNTVVYTLNDTGEIIYAERTKMG